MTTDDSTFRARKPQAEIANAIKLQRRLVSLGVIETYAETAGRSSTPILIEFESLVDYDHGTPYRRYRSDPTVLVEMRTTGKEDTVTKLAPMRSDTRLPSRYPEATSDVVRPLSDPLDW